MLTGLNQKVGNFPGVTVDKKTGGCKISENIYNQSQKLQNSEFLNSTLLSYIAPLKPVEVDKQLLDNIQFDGKTYDYSYIHGLFIFQLDRIFMVIRKKIGLAKQIIVTIPFFRLYLSSLIISNDFSVQFFEAIYEDKYENKPIINIHCISISWLNIFSTMK